MPTLGWGYEYRQHIHRWTAWRKWGVSLEERRCKDCKRKETR